MQANEIAKSISSLADQVVAQSLKQASDRFEEFRNEVNEKVNAMLVGRPVLHVQINEGEIKQLSKRAAAILPRLLVNAKLGLNSLMVGPAGCGKTTAAHQVAEALGLQFGSVCLTAGASETWLFGRQTPTGFVEGMFSKIYREGGVFLADEMDAADANLLLSINTALSHNEMLNPMNGEVIKKHKDFIFIGAGNTNGKGSNHLYTGRSRLDAATLDRFIVLMVDYDRDLEKELCKHSELFQFLSSTRGGLRQEGYDEFISTRAFAYCATQFEAGVNPEDIMKSLVANWGDSAKGVAEKSFKASFVSEKSGKAKKGKQLAQYKHEAYSYPDELKVDWNL